MDYLRMGVDVELGTMIKVVPMFGHYERSRIETRVFFFWLSYTARMTLRALSPSWPVTAGSSSLRILFAKDLICVPKWQGFDLPRRGTSCCLSLPEKKSLFA
jgi:hypothetical protein